MFFPVWSATVRTVRLTRSAIVASGTIRTRVKRSWASRASRLCRVSSASNSPVRLLSSLPTVPTSFVTSASERASKWNSV